MSRVAILPDKHKSFREEVENVRMLTTDGRRKTRDRNSALEPSARVH